MDTLTFDGYTSYSDASTPRTPSPTDMHFNTPHIKQDMDQPIRSLFSTDDEHGSGAHIVIPTDNQYWSSSANNHFSFNNNTHNNSRGSLLQELYEPESLTPEFPHHEPTFQGHQQHQQQSENWDLHGSQHNQRDFAMMRRATFPYVRHDREDGGVPMHQYSPFMAHQQQQMLHSQHHPHQQHPDMHPYSSRQDSLDNGFAESYAPPMSSSPHSNYHDFEDGTSIKLEDSSAAIMVPTQTNSFYRPHSSSSAGVAGHPMTLSYAPHSGLPVQHTDDAASKETQYLRRRCYNCHTTEPPSWRRSTLNPGKIVCNKCGLYERTHLRPRPLRFDELRAGNKARKGSKGSGTSPKQGKMMVKKEPREYGGGGIVRRSSVSSNSSAHSGSGASDWDDNVSIYSSGSAPPTSFNSPISNNFPLSRDSQSPPRDGGIRLPNNPLSDIASMHMQHPMQHQSTTPLLPSTVPRKSHSSPSGFYSPSMNASTMPSVAENVVWSTEPEDVSISNHGSPSGLGLISTTPELVASS